MPDLIDQLEALPGLGAGRGPEPDEIRARARRRTTRRRLVLGSALAAVLVVVTLAAPWRSDDAAQRVTTDPTEATSTTPTTSPSTTSSVPPAPATLPPGLAPSGLTAVPVVDLDDGEVITVTFDDPAEAERATFLAVCDGEVVNQAYQTETDTAGLLARCGPAVTDVADSARVVAPRVIDTPEGAVDCGANVGRCVVAAVLDTGDARWSPLGFTSGPQAPVTINVAPSGPVDDGTGVEVSGEGGLPGQTILIRPCLSRSAPDDEDATGCDAVRGVEVPVDDDGRYRADMILYRDLLTYSPDGSTASRWVPCEPCTLVAQRSNAQGEAATTPVEITADGPAIHPTVEIAEPGPYAPGQRVTLRGTGFQPSASRQPSLEICPADLMTQPFTGDCAGTAGVSTPGDGVPEVTPAGTFTLPGFQLPDAGLTTTAGLRCDTNRACAIGSTPGEGIAFLLSGPLDLSG